MAEEIVGEVVGIAAGMGGTHGADDLLGTGRLPVLLGDVVP